ncbi:unnamed protein product [Rhizophagus irregularis]|uniref:Uncharacterized protein n=1 Tax=Rhizophagus irregularis TaxID=588596 RepID=A0A915ZD45_9GLOM|nr:unnamed protein product [Rhizophagus irregularis]
MDRATARGAIGRTGAEQLRARLDQGDATGGTRLAEHREGLPYRPAPARDHQAPFGVGIDMDDADLVPIGLQLIGEDARERGADMLAHFGADDVDGDDAGGIDAEPDRRFKLRPRGGSGGAAGHGRIDRRQHVRKAEGESCGTAGDEKTPARKRAARGFRRRDEAAHALGPSESVPAACRIAARMRT